MFWYILDNGKRVPCESEQFDMTPCPPRPGDDWKWSRTEKRWILCGSLKMHYRKTLKFLEEQHEETIENILKAHISNNGSLEEELKFLRQVDKQIKDIKKKLG